MNKLYCNDGCQKEFSLTEMKVGVDALTGGIEHHYLECPHCKHKYTVFYSDEQIRSMQLKTQAMQKNSPLNIKQRNQLSRMVRKMQMLSNQIKMKVEQNVH